MVEAPPCDLRLGSPVPRRRTQALATLLGFDTSRPAMAQDGRSRLPHDGLPADISVAEMVENIIGCKWSVHLLRLVAEGHRRPSALLRASPGLSAKVMNERLRKMLRYGILQRVVHGEKPPLEVEYHLTRFGKRFLRIIEEVRKLQAAVDRRKSPLPRSPV